MDKKRSSFRITCCFYKLSGPNTNLAFSDTLRCTTSSNNADKSLPKEELLATP